jgi:hypothetical protein
MRADLARRRYVKNNPSEAPTAAGMMLKQICRDAGPMAAPMSCEEGPHADAHTAAMPPARAPRADCRRPSATSSYLLVRIFGW